MTPARIILSLAILAILAVIGLAGYIRLAPGDPARWHTMSSPKGIGDFPFQGGFEAGRSIDRPAADTLARLDRVILATPRTRRIAGSPETGMMTYVTRSALWGFPDYTTAWVIDGGAGSELHILGRLRFGRSDLGTNAARIRGWLAELGLPAPGS